MNVPDLPLDGEETGLPLEVSLVDSQTIETSTKKTGETA